MPDIKAPALNPNLLKYAEHERNLRHLTVPPLVTIADLMRPEWWAHAANRLKVYDKIEVRAQDNAWYAEVLVRSVGAQEATVWVVLYKDLNETDAAKDEPVTNEPAYKVEFGGGHKWRVVRVSDKAVVHRDEPDQAGAQAWLDNFLKTEA
jgi:hypothetical protein